MFPVSRKRRVKSLVRSTEEIPVYCKCRMPELPGDHMIESLNVLLVKSGIA